MEVAGLDSERVFSCFAGQQGSSGRRDSSWRKTTPAGAA